MEKSPYTETQRLYMQMSAAEVPGFNIRTQCDDAIGKLWALRNRLADPVPEGMAALLDDIEEMIERAIEIGFEPDAPNIGTDGVEWDGPLPEAVRRYAGGRLAESRSGVFWNCSCGGQLINGLRSDDG